MSEREEKAKALIDKAVDDARLAYNPSESYAALVKVGAAIALGLFDIAAALHEWNARERIRTGIE